MRNIMKLSVYLIICIAAGAFPVSAGQWSGLWIGQVEIGKVNEVTSKIDAATVKDVMNTFDLRLLLHSNAAGQVRMLRDVTLMQKRYMAVQNGESTEMVRRALITDDTLLSQFEGVVRKDGALVGVRLSSAGTEFEQNKNELIMSGTIEPGKTVSGTMVLSKDHPSNPFRHKFHPDHQYGIDITREVVLTFDILQQDGKPEDGVSKLGGKYQEIITGLHKSPLILEGKFHLERVSKIDMLNE
jgi:hypothetical protein